MSKNLYKSKMTLEVVDIVENSAAAGQEEESDTMEPPVKEEAVAAPKRRGRPPGSRDKQPRQRVPRLPAAMETEDIEEAPQPVLKREKRRTTTLNSASARRRVQVAVESDSPESASTEEQTPPPSPRTRRHQEWTAYRQQRASQYQEQVNHYARLFDRMLA